MTPPLPMGGYAVVCRDDPGILLPVWFERGFEENRHVVLELPDRRGPDGFVWCPPGWMKFGEKGAWTRVESGFWIARTEVTWEEYGAFLASPEGRNHGPHYWTGQAIAPVPDTAKVRRSAYPLFGVSELDGAAYCEWRRARSGEWRFRLPTELEWEWASRGADGRTYPWGDGWDPDAANWKGDRQEFRLDSVFEPAAGRTGDRSVFGVLGTAGNVAEWTSTPGKGETCVTRGGYWGSQQLECRSWFSISRERSSRHGGVGFRVVAVAETR